MDDVDELAGDTVPCSPGAVLRHDHETQPTQVLGGAPGRLRNGRSSSPASIVEVPASSPFQQAEKRSVPTPTTTAPPKPKSLGTRLAPAGTVFRPPPKRPATSDPVHVISDDEDEDEGNTQDAAPRGDIRPTTFQTRISSFMYNQASGADKERKTREKLRQIYDVFGPRYPSDMVRRALRETDDDVEEAMAWLEKNGKKAAKGSAAKTAAPASKAVAPPAPKAAAPKPRRLVSKASLQATRPSPAASASPSPSPEKPKPKRQLVRGLRNVETTPSPKKQPPPSSADPLVVVDLVENDRDDAYEAEASPDPDDDDGLGRVLECINTCTAAELAAMTSLKEAQLEPIMERRPFADLDEARDVSAARKPGARKTARTSIGESVVDAIEVFLDAVEAIDHIVSECENKARTVNAVMDTWEVNSFGYKRGAPTAGSGSSRNTPDLPPTPTSLSAGKLCKPPIPAQPTAMDGHCTMKPFQLFGLNWMSLLHTYDIGCILADEMGLGKTCQVISLMAHLVEAFEKQGKDVDSDERPWPNLVVVPPSTYNNWLAEFAKFAPDLKVVGYRGSQGERMEIAEEVAENPQEVHVVLGTYSQINSESDVDSLNSMGLHAAVFDEGHKMKNPETKIYRDLRRIRTDWKMLLTGTPVQNNLLEMISLLSFINPAMFDGYMEPIKYMFSTKVTIRDVSNGAFLYRERVKRARTILEPFILQRRKDQVLSEMPRKVHTQVLCDMTERQRAVYDEYERIFKMEPSQRAISASASAAAKGRQNDQNNVWMQLRKAAIHPLLFRRHFDDAALDDMAGILMDRVDQRELCQPNMGHLVQELRNSSDFDLHLWCRDYPPLLGRFDYASGTELDSGKVRRLLELLETWQGTGERALVFSKFSRVIELLREVLAVRGVDHRVLMGNTNVSERQEMIDEFNADPSIPVFLLTTGAGGTGINLTSANKVVIFDQSDNPQDDIQAENRAHRLGQRRDVEVVRLLSRGTIEELINKACQKKIELADRVTGASEATGQPEDEATAAATLEHEVRAMMMKNGDITPP